jgi:hypothetical protein
MVLLLLGVNINVRVMMRLKLIERGQLDLLLSFSSPGCELRPHAWLLLVLDHVLTHHMMSRAKVP